MLTHVQDRMTPATRLDVVVQVLVDDTWHDGILEHWRQRGTAGVGAQHIGWYDQELLRQA